MYFTTIGKTFKLNKCEYTCERIILHTKILQYITSNINLSLNMGGKNPWSKRENSRMSQMSNLQRTVKAVMSAFLESAGCHLQVSLSLTSEDFKTFPKSLFFHIPSSPMCGFPVLIHCDLKHFLFPLHFITCVVHIASVYFISIHFKLCTFALKN